MLIGYLFVFAAILATSIGVVTYKEYSRNKSKITLFFTVALLMLAPIISFNALQYLSVDVVYMATSLNGLVVLFMTRFFLKENVTCNQFMGAVLVFIGVSVYMV
ncbi:EamA family transporter [Vibrio sp. 10N.222.54.F12]|uniref:EamA family transporter n=1 Tax=Vibrio TaxID=662 RepID=UPI00037BCCAC|nr:MULTISPECIES: EamA family transporter [Vibrio]OEF72887.1 hypothetical protein A152_11540 [Vibrio tasmaniensis 1F-187]PML18551.1 hypothetical protein BCT83_04480 [Vibrio tasmaniensis]PML49381.1 hypothetical protein BCT76_08270 [Vibrio tasmaniensis]WKY58266.1 EamA family transporter [Vibrio sp. SNU_ST1]